MLFVGYVDWEVRNFHGYSTHRGSSYNAYIVKTGQKTVLIDTVKRPYFDYYLQNIREVVDPAEIDYLIINHVEPDHSGAFPEILKYLSKAEVIASEKGVENLKLHYHKEIKDEIFDKIRKVKQGDTLDIGDGKSFTFVPIPMIHWPDSMVSFMSDAKGKNILFSNDAFGQHYATSKIWDDENDLSIVMAEAEKYYANILMHLSRLIAKVLPAVGALPIDVICPSHGICWKTHLTTILDAYKKWSAGEIEEKSVLIVYDTMWGSTEKIAIHLYQGFKDRGIKVKRFCLTHADYSDVITEAMKAKAILIGSPTLNNGMFPTVAEYVCYQKGLKPMNKIGLAFGSHGWAGGAVREITREMQGAGIDMMEDTIEIQFVPTAEQLNFDEIIDKVIKKME